MAMNGQAEEHKHPSAAQTRAAVLPTGTKKEKLAGASSGSAALQEFDQPYSVEVVIEGICPIIFHRYDCDAVKEKGEAKKGSKQKTTDDIESYVYRDSAGLLCVPGININSAIIRYAKFLQDPRSKRKSAEELWKSGVIIPDEFCSCGVKDWDYIDKRPVRVQHARVPRERPALREGWKLRFTVNVIIPEFVDQYILHHAITEAGRLCGLCEMRPRYGRFQVNSFKILSS